MYVNISVKVVALEVITKPYGLCAFCCNDGDRP